MMPLAMVNKGTFIFLQALGKAGLSMTLSMAREILFGVFLSILLPRIFGLDGLLYSFPAADILTFILTLITATHVYWELSTGSPRPGGTVPAAV
jgi:Na+-driven multidrug efflux pump